MMEYLRMTTLQFLLCQTFVFVYLLSCGSQIDPAVFHYIWLLFVGLLTVALSDKEWLGHRYVF